jgi:ribulose-bisphosphate carboxylase large chain
MARFEVVYSLLATDADDAAAQAFAVAVEQTIEFPHDLVTNTYVRDEITGRVESVEPMEPSDCTDADCPGQGTPDGMRRFRTVISYDEATCGSEFTQFINVVFGNSSMKPGVRVESIHPTAVQSAVFRGPGFGISGIRDIVGVHHRPLLCSAIKPMGLDCKTLADMAYRFALGGIDFIKDDHGLADQRFAPFHERIPRCMEAVERANRETGRRCLYIPNVTADGGQTLQRAIFARRAGASAVIVSGALTGLSILREVATCPDVGLPVFFHPAFCGSYTVSPASGFSQSAYYGQLMRLSCADAVIFPSFGGRFSFSRAQCGAIADGCRMPMHGLLPAFPAPGGGMNFHNFAESIDFYGNDAIFLIGGGLFRHSPDITRSVSDLLALVEGQVLNRTSQGPQTIV